MAGLWGERGWGRGAVQREGLTPSNADAQLCKPHHLYTPQPASPSASYSCKQTSACKQSGLHARMRQEEQVVEWGGGVSRSGGGAEEEVDAEAAEEVEVEVEEEAEELRQLVYCYMRAGGDLVGECVRSGGSVGRSGMLRGSGLC